MSTEQENILYLLQLRNVGHLVGIALVASVIQHDVSKAGWIVGNQA